MAVDLALAVTRPIAPVVALVERGRLRAFARAIGETDPVHTDVDAARAAGHPDLLVPPTFFFSIELEADPPLGWLTDLGVDLRGVLHGEQSFTYHRDVHAGEEIECRRRVSDAYAKSPTRDFLVKRTDFLRAGELVAEAEAVVIVTAL
ncbi:MaoC family dehydratase N-terminal domain-containing protein [Umezawaea sp. Da 62-37]|uniref:MaoC family dehydratase N-terminal domain-containing protein n=1 Tax=Umezawaea sp. Da 62-37 TaxID=3075927 RepID=UPI0028F744BD|nr:MaoC family dehydratase N-terminal domain-containing protein [Umezawaea sp. Da 62-37]WNV86888.1 MaoC family dehydratase N-terminal domain-containing protein [Umezawaea sp. Da 62-37]